jgi:lycopene cyclase domain-containing protein
MQTYLLVDLCALSVPLWKSFDRRINLHHKWQFLFPAIILSGIVFIAWDILFTSWGVWGFNPRYLCGLWIAGLPIEEWLFFICIPYACIFSYEALSYFIPKIWFPSSTIYITLSLSLLFITIGLLNTDKLYTASTFLGCGSFILLLHFYFKISYLDRFYQTYLFILIPFFIVNGLLTGTGLEEAVVWYNDSENLGIRILTIPIEDSVYGMFLILLNLSIFERLKRRKVS